MAICFNRNSCWPILDHSAQTASSMRRMAQSSTFPVRFPFSNFRYSLTLFSKFFASFPHGTCTLSVSHQYLALDGIYHPLWAAIPSNSTRRKHLPWAHIPSKNGSLTLSAAFFQRTWPEMLTYIASKDHNSAQIKSVQIHMVSYSRFSRPYWGNPC